MSIQHGPTMIPTTPLPYALNYAEAPAFPSRLPYHHSGSQGEAGKDSSSYSWVLAHLSFLPLYFHVPFSTASSVELKLQPQTQRLQPYRDSFTSFHNYISLNLLINSLVCVCICTHVYLPMILLTDWTLSDISFRRWVTVASLQDDFLASLVGVHHLWSPLLWVRLACATDKIWWKW